MPSALHAFRTSRLTYRCASCLRTITRLNPTQPFAAPRCAHCDAPMELVQLVREVRIYPHSQTVTKVATHASASIY